MPQATRRRWRAWRAHTYPAHLCVPDRLLAGIEAIARFRK
jgi:hypothetical protein